MTHLPCSGPLRPGAVLELRQHHAGRHRGEIPADAFGALAGDLQPKRRSTARVRADQAAGRRSRRGRIGRCRGGRRGFRPGARSGQGHVGSGAPSTGEPSATAGAPTAKPPIRPVPPAPPHSTPVAAEPEGDTFPLQSEPAKATEAAAPQDSAPAAAAEKTAAEPVAKAPPEKAQEGEQPEAKPKPTQADDENQIPHSEATGGDVLLQVALQEQMESEQRRKSGGRRRPNRPASSEPGLIVYCANGCRIKVAERHRGKVGKCPRCSALFIVPNKSVDEQRAEIAAAKSAAAQSEETGPKEYSAGRYVHWMTDLHSHSVDPKKLKLVPGSLEKTFTSVDVAFADDGLLLLTLAKPGMFGKIDPGKLEQAREEVLAFLRGEPSEAVKTKIKKAREAEGKKRAAEAAKKEADAKKAAAKAKKEKEKAKKGKKGKDAPPTTPPTVEAAASETKPPEPKVEDPFEFLPALEFDAVPAELVRQISVVQPVMYEHESMFAGVPVFGMGRIAVLIPTANPEATKRCLSLTLTEFRRLQTILEEQFGVTDLIDGLDIPLNDNLQPVTCHYTEQAFGRLDQSQYYLADPAFQLTVVGRQCQNCGLIVSEDARKKEKIGGANGKGIAKAKCPKCGEKFGEITLYSIANQKPDEASDEASSNIEATTDADSEGVSASDPTV